MLSAPGPRQGLFLAISAVLILAFLAVARNSDVHPISNMQTQVAAWSGSQSAFSSSSSSSKSSKSSSSSSAAKKLFGGGGSKLPSGPPPPSRKIWQTAKSGALDLDQQSQTNIRRWIEANPDWRYELLTDFGMDTYVRERFRAQPEIIDVFTQLGDSILRADFIRYLVLLGDGGVYSDLDTECIKPIEEWPASATSTPPASSSSSGDPDAASNLAFVGIEYDTFGQGHVGALLDLQLINWTLMARRRGHGLFQRVAERVASGLRELAANQSVGLADIQANFNDVLATTGPAALTLATWDYLTEQTGAMFDWRNVSGITEPLHVADVVILPVTAWGNGQAHSHAGTPEDPAALVHHQFKGGWKTGGHSFDHMKGKDKGKAGDGAAAADSEQQQRRRRSLHRVN